MGNLWVHKVTIPGYNSEGETTTASTMMNNSLLINKELSDCFTDGCISYDSGDFDAAMDNFIRAAVLIRSRLGIDASLEEVKKRFNALIYG